MSTNVPTMHGEWNVPYDYTMGSSAVAFFEALKDRRILGARCRGCERIFVPPKGFCEFCFIPIEELREVGNKGSITAVTIVTAGFRGSRPVPYAVAYVRLDDATSSIANFLDAKGLGTGQELPKHLRVGARVKAVFTDSPQGRVTDFWFEPE
jgi:uncharacterized OB-fold protein